MTSTKAPPRFGVAALVGVGLVGVYSATWRLDRSDWKLDEDAYAQAGWYLVHDGFDPNLGHPPLAKLAFGASQVVFGRNLGAVRAVAAVGVLVSIAVLFAFGRRIGGWWTGVLAAALFASVLAHEFSHALVARARRVRVDEIMLSPVAASYESEPNATSPGRAQTLELIAVAL